MTELGVPLVGQLSVVGLLLGIVVTVFIMVIKGDLITPKRQSQIDAQHKDEMDAERVRHASELEAEQARSRAWQEAWQAGQNLDAQKTETIRELASLAEVFQKFIHSLPKPSKDRVDDDV